MTVPSQHPSPPAAAPAEPRFAPNVAPRRVAALPSAGRLMTVGAVAVLLPGIVVYAILRLAGLANGPSVLLGLLAMFGGLVWYPTYLRRVGKRLDASMSTDDGSSMSTDDGASLSSDDPLR